MNKTHLSPSEQRVYADGAADYYDGRELRDNPYANDDNLGPLWADGWNVAFREDSEPESGGE